MSREYPDWVDPWKAAEGRKIVSGSMPLSRMARLGPMLADTAGEAHFVASFSFDSQGMVTIAMEVDATLQLVCQRSLEPYPEKVSRRSVLGVMENMADEHMMPENYEPVHAAHRRLALLDLVEEELLLAVPQVPRSPDTQPVDWLAGEDGEILPPQSGENVRQPFADLAEKMKKHRAQSGDES